MDMAIMLHDGLCWTYPTSICHVHPHDTTRRVGLAAFLGSFLAPAGPVKVAFSRPTHPRVTQAVGWLRRLPKYRHLAHGAGN
jgi:hypothetical protein